MVDVTITATTGASAARAPVEIVERKGLGHPDTICDALAEQVSLALSRYYRDRFGLILHHNADKALLLAGRSQPAFKGGRVLEPSEFFFAGRATTDYRGVKVPVDELVVETTRRWLDENFHALDAEQHVRIHTLLRPGSVELVELFLRQQQTGVALANDTSCGVGYAPLDQLEQLVLKVEQQLNSLKVKSAHPAIGEDIKVMGVRRGTSMTLTIGCAFVGRYLADIREYMEMKATVAELAQKEAQQVIGIDTPVVVNNADGDDENSIYLTVTGTSAEAGDDGEVGRGNRVNGLITPCRPMNMEAAAGKNPVTHVGKLYNIIAQDIAAAIVSELPAVEEAICFLVSRIGHPIQEPQVVDLRLQLSEGIALVDVEQQARAMASSLLQTLPVVQDRLLEGALTVY